MECRKTRVVSYLLPVTPRPCLGRAKWRPAESRRIGQACVWVGSRKHRKRMRALVELSRAFPSLPGCRITWRSPKAPPHTCDLFPVYFLLNSGYSWSPLQFSVRSPDPKLVVLLWSPHSWSLTFIFNPVGAPPPHAPVTNIRAGFHFPLGLTVFNLFSVVDVHLHN